MVSLANFGKVESIRELLRISPAVSSALETPEDQLWRVENLESFYFWHGGNVVLTHKFENFSVTAAIWHELRDL